MTHPRLILPALLLLGQALGLDAENVHLQCSPDGRQPHQALRQAREVRRLHQIGEGDTLFIHLADGIYRLGETLLVRPEDSGTPASPTIFVADHAGRAVLSGGKALQMDATMDGRRTAQVGTRHPADVRQLWRSGGVKDRPIVNGQIVNDKVPHASLVPLDQMLPLVDFRKEEREIWVARRDFEPLLASGREATAGLEMIVHQRWAIAILRIRDYRVEGEVVKLTFEEPESRLEFEHPWPQPVINEDRGDGVRVSSSYNILGGASVMKPGTWYQDAQDGSIVYSPCEGENPSQMEFTVPLLHTLLEVDGSLERRVHDVTFRGICFEHAAWTRPSELGHVTLQGGMYLLDAYGLQVPGLPEKAYLENQAWIERPEAAVSVRGGIRINFEGCRFSHLGATGLDYVWADSACVVSQCHFEDIGGTALALGAFPDRGFETHVPFRPQNMQELCSDFRIEHNTIHDVTNEDWGCVGIGAGYVADVTIADNEVSELNYSGICVGWGWTPLNSGMKNNHILRNHVHHFARRLYDAGGIYLLSYQPGSSIEDNVLEDIYPPLYATNLRGFYIYFDEATDGFRVLRNRCPKALFGDNRPGPDIVWEDNGPAGNGWRPGAPK